MVTAIFLVLCMMMTVFAGAADTAKGTTLRLEDVTGTVTVKKANGSTIKTKTGSKLYNGYKVATGAKSYAWISLDDDVLVKLDERSSVTIEKSGKKLEVKLSTGSLFFNVSKKLKEGKKLNIRTSSMTTGVRGTSGIVRAGIVPQTQTPEGTGARSVSELVLCEGRVDLTYTLPDENGLAAGTETTELTAGWQASVTSSLQKDGSAPEVQVEVKKTSVRQELMDCGFAATEVAKNKDLQDKLTSGGAVSKKDIEEIASNADDQLKKDEQASEAQAEAQQTAASDAKKDAEKQAEADTGSSSRLENTFPSTPSTSGGGHSSSSSAPETVTVTFVNGSDTQTQTIEKGKTAAKPSSPTNGKWLLNGTEFDFSRAVNENITLIWQENEPEPTVPETVTVTFVNGDDTQTQTIEKGKTAAKPSSPTNGRWLLDGEKFDFTTPVTADITLHWEENKPETKYYTVTFYNQNGRQFAKQSVEEGKTAAKPRLSPTQSGRWLLDGAEYDFSLPVTENLTLHWSLK